MKSPFHFSLSLTALGAAVLALSLAGCGQKGPLYLGKPPPPHPVRNAEPAGAPDDAADVTTNVIDMNGAVEMSVMPSSGPDGSGPAASDSK